MLALSCSPATLDRRSSSLFADARLVLDFTRRMARLNGSVLPLEAVLSCLRASPGKALSAGGTLHDFAANTLRCTSRGLLVEEPRTNYFPNSFVPAGDVHKLAEALARVSADGALRTRIAAQARADFLDGYDIVDYRGRLEAIYREALGRT